MENTKCPNLDLRCEIYFTAAIHFAPIASVIVLSLDIAGARLLIHLKTNLRKMVVHICDRVISIKLSVSFCVIHKKTEKQWTQD